MPIKAQNDLPAKEILERENIFVPPIPAGTSSGGRCSTSSSSKKRSKKIVKRKIKKK